MKKFRNLCFVLLLAIVTVFCMTACDSQSTVTYEITVDAQGVSTDTSAIKVCVYSLDGALVKEESLSQNKAKFQLKSNSYVATLSGLTEEVSFSSVLLTKSSRKATIALDNSVYDDLSETYSFAFTVILLNGDKKLSDLSGQICDELMCRDVDFDKNVVDIRLSGGECTVEVYEGNDEIYNEAFTLDLDVRFYIIKL